MSRLTERTEQGSAFTYSPIHFCGDCYIGEAIDKLADYEDAEEQGLLLRLPCKVGDTVYTVDYYYECDCDYECVELDDYKCEEDLPCEHQYKVYRVREMKFQEQMLVLVGKTVFLTKEEAEQKLESIKGE